MKSVSQTVGITVSEGIRARVRIEREGGLEIRSVSEEETQRGLSLSSLALAYINPIISIPQSLNTHFPKPSIINCCTRDFLELQRLI